MFNFSGSEIVFLLLLALIVLGPEKLPEAVRKFGKTYAEFKKVTTGFQSELKSALDEPMREMRETADAFKKAATFDLNADFDPDPVDAAKDGDTKPIDAAVIDKSSLAFKNNRPTKFVPANANAQAAATPAPEPVASGGDLPEPVSPEPVSPEPVAALRPRPAGINFTSASAPAARTGESPPLAADQIVAPSGTESSEAETA